MLREDFQLGIFILNTLTILSFCIIVFLGLLAGVGYCCVVIELTSHAIFSILMIGIIGMLLDMALGVVAKLVAYEEWIVSKDFVSVQNLSKVYLCEQSSDIKCPPSGEPKIHGNENPRLKNYPNCVGVLEEVNTLINSIGNIKPEIISLIYTPKK